MSVLTTSEETREGGSSPTPPKMNNWVAIAAIVPQHVMSRIPLPTANNTLDKISESHTQCDLYIDIDGTLYVTAGGDCLKY